MIPGAVLAAGRSSRMGRSKALLPCGLRASETFLGRIVASMRIAGLHDVLVVGRPDDTELIDAVLAMPTPARFVPNPHHERGQISSIVAAVNAVDHPGVAGLLVMPVDIPLVRPDTYADILRVAHTHAGRIVRATHGGRHGHPVVFDRGSFDALRHADPSVGAKAVLHGGHGRVIDHEVPDDGVLKDVDSVQDYAEIFGGEPDEPGSSVPS